MKKLLTVIAVLCLFAFIHVTNAQAEEKYVAGGFEASGHIMTGLGYQHYGKNAAMTTYRTYDGDYFYGAGVLGKYISKPELPRTNMFSFFVDEVELDLAKSFGENIRLRADLDFSRNASSGSQYGTPAFVLEQAYATANIPIGNGLEVLLGRFNTPIGFEAVDASENDTISKSVIATGLRPTNTTGLKLYYSFSDLIDLHIYAVNTLTQDNNLNGAVQKTQSLPGFGLRLGFNWGEEGTESTIGVSGLFGPGSFVSNKHYTYTGDLDFNWWITESFAIGGEAIYRRDNAVGGATLNNFYMAGLLNLHYLFSDVWDGTLKYTWAKDFHGTNGAYDLTDCTLGLWRQSIMQGSLAGGYAVADGAKLKLEARMDMVKPSVGGMTQYIYGGALAFAYDF